MRDISLAPRGFEFPARNDKRAGERNKGEKREQLSIMGEILIHFSWGRRYATRTAGVMGMERDPLPRRGVLFLQTPVSVCMPYFIFSRGSSTPGSPNKIANETLGRDAG